MKRILSIVVSVVAFAANALAIGGTSKVPFADPYILLDNNIFT